MDTVTSKIYTLVANCCLSKLSNKKISIQISNMTVIDCLSYENLLFGTVKLTKELSHEFYKANKIAINDVFHGVDYFREILIRCDDLVLLERGIKCDNVLLERNRVKNLMTQHLSDLIRKEFYMFKNSTLQL